MKSNKKWEEERKKALKSSAAKVTVNLNVAAAAVMIEELGVTVGSEYVFVIETWIICPPWFRDAPQNFLVGLFNDLWRIIF